MCECDGVDTLWKTRETSQICRQNLTHKNLLKNIIEIKIVTKAFVNS